MAKVLCFDDEANHVLGSIEEYLREFCGHIVKVVANLAEAEEKIRDQRYDVLLLDIRIVEEKRIGVAGYENKVWTRTGVRLIERIREREIHGATNPIVPIVVLTAVVHPPTLKEIETIGSRYGAFVRVIQKPPRLADIGDAIKDGLEWTAKLTSQPESGGHNDSSPS